MKIPTEKIIEARERLGDKAKTIMEEEIPLIGDGKMYFSIFKEENTPSMAWFSDRQILKDFSTGKTMDYIDFAIKYHNLSFYGAVKELFELVGFEYDNSDFITGINNDTFMKNYKFPLDEPLNNRENVNKYAKERGISLETLDFCNVKESANGNIAFQLFNTNYKHVATKYRIIGAYNKGKENSPKWWWQKGASNCPILYGIERVDYTKPLVICEGYFDRLSVVESGYTNCVSIPGGAQSLDWIEWNFDFLQMFKIIIIWFDGDEAGQSMISKVVDKLGLDRTKIIKPYEIESGSPLYNLPHKDANDILVYFGATEVIKCIETAEYTPNPHLKYLFNIKEVELADLPRISTGFESLDYVVYGTFNQTLNVLTAPPGNGKSVIATLMGVISPLEAGKKVMIFSGEFSNESLVGNMFRPFAGRNHIIEIENKNNKAPSFYKVTKRAKEAVRDFYLNNLIFYDNSDELITDSEGILHQMEYSYKRYGVTFFVIDNLMCIKCGANDNDKYSGQIDFVIKLKRFTRIYDATILLVAHPKKMAYGQTQLDMYSVAGASEIVNVADRVYSTGILDPATNNGYNTFIKILKDRQSGRSNKEIKMYYDYPSTRIYSTEKELFKKFSWEEQFNYVYDSYTQQKIVGRKRISQDQNEVLGEITNAIK